MSIQPAMKDAALAALTDEIDALAAEAMAEWKVPAVAMAVVQNGETIEARAKVPSLEHDREFILS